MTLVPTALAYFSKSLPWIQCESDSYLSMALSIITFAAMEAQFLVIQAMILKNWKKAGKLK